MTPVIPVIEGIYGTIRVPTVEMLCRCVTEQIEVITYSSDYRIPTKDRYRPLTGAKYTYNGDLPNV